MKKIVFLFLGLINLSVYAQIYFEVQSPTPIQGYQPTSLGVAQATGGWTNIPDLMIPTNSITQTLVLVDDGTIEDTLGCNSLINGIDMNGKIALVYRGVCDFSTKALNAQSAGAIGVVIVNNLPNDPAFNPGGGANGPLITIPVVMIPYESGQQILPHLTTGGRGFYWSFSNRG
jgi:hypothetical protein